MQSQRGLCCHDATGSASSRPSWPRCVVGGKGGERAGGGGWGEGADLFLPKRRDGTPVASWGDCWNTPAPPTLPGGFHCAGGRWGARGSRRHRAGRAPPYLTVAKPPSRCVTVTPHRPRRATAARPTARAAGRPRRFARPGAPSWPGGRRWRRGSRRAHPRCSRRCGRGSHVGDGREGYEGPHPPEHTGQ